MIAQLSVYPLGEGTSVSRFVKKGVAVIEASGLPYEIGGMSTSVETPDLDTLFDLIKKVHAAHVAEGAQRLVIDLKVDDRRDTRATIESKKKSVTGKS
ncbi:MAG: MTH1187 family thiamine-binding protein [Candidatus Desulfacyla sp.]